jgi:serine protease Do
VWLRPAGEYDFDQLVATWKPHCEQHRLILVAPKSAHATGWQPTELGFLRRVMEHVLDQYPADRRRVVAHGSQIGGAMAYLAGLSHRELIRGIALVDAAFPARLRIPDNDPLLRFAIFSAVPAGARSQPAVEAGLAALRERKYPVQAIQQAEGAKGLSESERNLLVRWMDSLDRL